MNKIIKLQKKSKTLFEEKHKRDEIFQAFGLAQCHQLDWQINYVIEQIKKEGIRLWRKQY